MNRIQRVFLIHQALLRGESPRDAAAWSEMLDVSERTILRDMAFLRKQLEGPLVFDSELKGYRYDNSKAYSMSENKTSKWTRLLTLIHRIYAEPGQTAKDLAEFTGRTERTIFRDIRELEMAGFPLYHDEGYHFATDAFLPAMNLTPGELFSLFVAVRMLESQNSQEVGAEARRALEKLVRVTKESKRLDLGQLKDAVHIPETPMETGADHLRIMQNALASGQKLSITYQGMKDDEPRPREVDPVGLFCHQQAWYLHAYDHSRQGMRNFRLSRIGGTQLTGEPIEHEAKMELEEASYHKWDVEGGEKQTVRIRVTESLGRWLRENPPHPSQEFQDHVVSYEVSDPLAMTRWITSLYGLEVLEPEVLRDELRKVCLELFEVYAGTSTVS